MKDAYVLLNFKYFNDSALNTRASAVLLAMTGNSYYPTPTPDLSTLSSIIQNYSQALSDAESNDKVKVSAKNQQRKLLINAMVLLASYINFTAAGDRTALISSAYDVSAESTTPNKLGSANNFIVDVGKIVGGATLSVDAVEGAVSYSFMYSLAPVLNDAWTTVTSTARSFSFTGLESLKPYCFRIGIAGTKGQFIYTDVIIKSVL